MNSRSDNHLIYFIVFYMQKSYKKKPLLNSITFFLDEQKVFERPALTVTCKKNIKKPFIERRNNKFAPVTSKDIYNVFSEILKHN